MKLLNKLEEMKSAAKLVDLALNMSVKTSIITKGKVELFGTDINR